MKHIVCVASFAFSHLAVEELEELQDELLVDDLLPDRRLEVGALQEPQEKLVNQLKQRDRSKCSPQHFQSHHKIHPVLRTMHEFIS